ncbi:Putative SOS response-associated peptidase YedK [Cognatiyoonia koreensis]|uniref:Abasic site processing protein n=1 Tax=Cognatiyoonia koreensis TaxID=364200 RepID=A0A1I0MUP4_9RHOB|nr:SOS response-associated peptidase [Cognatiyoonia koreensis]SEV92080.1 Putative SOS response-associated peptidase YedK [Cognatiyoonia koreensis]
MPGRFFLTRPDLLGLDTQPRANIAPGEDVWVQTAKEMRLMRWGMIPVGRTNARGRPVLETIINVRSETLYTKSAFEGLRRAVVPVEGWYEWTGEKRRKTAWAIRPKDGGVLHFAAVYDIWQAPGGTEVAQVATLTCAPSADVRDIHHRMGVILKREDVSVWLGDDQNAAADLMVPYPDGRLSVTPATDVDWTAP